MKHSFYVFPAGLTGTALFLLRISTLASLVTLSAAASNLQAWPLIGVGVIALALSLGYRTRIAACAVLGIVALDTLLAWPMFPPAFLAQALDAAALAMVGPGAFSIDARLFGRRTVHLPQ